MRSYLRVALGCALVAGMGILSGCGKKAVDDNTNIVEMNASDGTMNDMTVVESATLDQAGGSLDAGNATSNDSNAM